MLTLATVNVNGIRAAARKGMDGWLNQTKPEILCLQEVRAPGEELRKLAEGDGPLSGSWSIFDQEASAKGRAGVAVLTTAKVLNHRTDIGPDEFDSLGRWLETDIETKNGTLTVVSCYVHSGEADTPKQVEKYKFLDAMRERMAELMASQKLAVIVGDLNVGHTELDI
ncbi:endonuclease/exonuclease/phosphatase family protein, partial [Aquiluna sp.]|nr:endonuclease/exonuclease/phosphatase family protein [Aquiluna sp.]